MPWRGSTYHLPRNWKYVKISESHITVSRVTDTSTLLYIFWSSTCKIKLESLIEYRRTFRSILDKGIAVGKRLPALSPQPASTVLWSRDGTVHYKGILPLSILHNLSATFIAAPSYRRGKNAVIQQQIQHDKILNTLDIFLRFHHVAQPSTIFQPVLLLQDIISQALHEGGV